jgi:hypothetical protein
MIVIECEQGSAEWLQSRAGVCTASMFSTARKKVNCLDDRQSAFVAAVLGGMEKKAAAEQTGYKNVPTSEGIVRALKGEKVGEWSDGAKDYAFRLAIERISGKPLDEGFETWSMRRGHELEPHARMEHEMQTGLFVKRAGFVTTDDGIFGASADGFIGDDGGSEYKCFVDPGRLRAIYMDDDFSEIHDQAQGCMWLTGRKFWHICLYCPALELVGKQLWWREFKRDEGFIEKMEQDLWEFAMLVNEYEAALRKQAA